MTNGAIHVQNLAKRYGEFVAVDDVSFSVPSGQIFGFLGPNGAGKSTTVKILTTLALPSAGTATVGGYDVVDEAAAIRRVAGVALQDVGLDPLMKPMELFRIQGQFFGMSRQEATQRGEELLELVRLTEARERRVGTYSGGMKRRLDLALALIHDPDILFLDEPTTGLDPASRRDVWREVERLNRELGMTIFLTTQYLEEADALADVVAIIDRGRLVAEGAPEKLKARLGDETINLTFANQAVAADALNILQDMGQLQLDRETVRLYLPEAAAAVAQVVGRLQSADLTLSSLTLTQPTLDDVFLELTGQRLEAEAATETGEI